MPNSAARSPDVDPADAQRPVVAPLDGRRPQRGEQLVDVAGRAQPGRDDGHAAVAGRVQRAGLVSGHRLHPLRRAHAEQSEAVGEHLTRRLATHSRVRWPSVTGSSPRGVTRVASYHLWKSPASSSR